MQYVLPRKANGQTSSGDTACVPSDGLKQCEIPLVFFVHACCCVARPVSVQVRVFDSCLFLVLMQVPRLSALTPPTACICTSGQAKRPPPLPKEKKKPPSRHNTGLWGSRHAGGNRKHRRAFPRRAGERDRWDGTCRTKLTDSSGAQVGTATDSLCGCETVGTVLRQGQYPRSGWGPRTSVQTSREPLVWLRRSACAV